MRYLNYRHPSYLVGFLIISVLILCGLSIPYLFNTLYSARNASENFNQRLECASAVDCYGFSICDSNTCKANYRIFSIPFFSEKFDTNLKRTPLPWILDSIRPPTDVSDTIFTNTGVTLYVVDKQHIFVSLAYHHAVADNLSETVEQKREYIQRLLGPYLDMETYIFADSDTSTANSKRFFKSYVLPASKLQNNIRNTEFISGIHVISPHVYLIHYESQTMDLIFMDTAGLSSCKRLPYYKHDIQKDNLNSYVSTLFDNERPGDWNLELVMPTGSHWILLMKSKNGISPKRKKLPIRMDLLGELIKPVQLQPIDESLESIENSITTNKNHPLTSELVSVKDPRLKTVKYDHSSHWMLIHPEFKTSELFKTLNNFRGKKVRFIDSAVSRNKITPSSNRPMSDLYPYIFNDDVVSSLNPKLVLVQPLHTSFENGGGVPELMGDMWNKNNIQYRNRWRERDSFDRSHFNWLSMTSNIDYNQNYWKNKYPSIESDSSSLSFEDCKPFDSVIYHNNQLSNYDVRGSFLTPNYTADINDIYGLIAKDARIQTIERALGCPYPCYNGGKYLDVKEYYLLNASKMLVCDNSNSRPSDCSDENTSGRYIHDELENTNVKQSLYIHVADEPLDDTSLRDAVDRNHVMQRRAMVEDDERIRANKRRETRLPNLKKKQITQPLPENETVPDGTPTMCYKPHVIPPYVYESFYYSCLTDRAVRPFFETFMNEHGISFIDILLFIYELIHVVNQEVGDKSYFDNSNLINFVYPFQRGGTSTISVLVEDTKNYEELILNQFHRLSPIKYPQVSVGRWVSRTYIREATDGDFKNYFRVFEHFPNNFLNDTTNVTRLKQLVEKILDMRGGSINFTIPPDTYNTKRINHFKTMFGTFEKEFGSAMFFQENVYAHKGRTVLGNASDFVSKLDSLYSEGYVPTTFILKCNLKGNLTNYTNNLFGSHGSTTVIKHFMIKMKDLFLTNVNNFYCHTGTSCIKGQERYRFNLQSYWGGSRRERNLKRVVSDVYFVCFTAPAGESMDGFIIPPKTQWIPMYSILYYNIITGDTVHTMIENCLDDNFNGNVFYTTSKIFYGPDLTLTNFDITYSKVGATTLHMEEFVGGVTTWFVNRENDKFTRYPEELNGGIYTRLYNQTTYANVHFYSPHETICYGFYGQWLSTNQRNLLDDILDGMGFGPIETSMTAPGFDTKNGAYDFHLRKAFFPAGAIKFPALSFTETLSIGTIHLVFQLPQRRVQNLKIPIKQYNIQSKTKQIPTIMNDGYMLLYDKYTTQMSTVKIYISENMKVTPSIAVVGGKSFENLRNELKELSDNHRTLFNSVSDIAMYSEPSRQSLGKVNFDNRSFQIVSTLSTPSSTLSTSSYKSLLERR